VEIKSTNNVLVFGGNQDAWRCVMLGVIVTELFIFHLCFWCGGQPFAYPLPYYRRVRAKRPLFLINFKSFATQHLRSLAAMTRRWLPYLVQP